MIFRIATIWRLALALVVSVGLLLSSTPVRAEGDQIVLKHLPRGERMMIDGEERMTFSLEAYKKLINMDLQLQTCEKFLGPIQDSNRIMITEMEQLRKNNESLANVILTQQDRIEELTDKYVQADLRWRKEKYKPKWGNWFSYAAAAGGILFGTGVLLAAQAD